MIAVPTLGLKKYLLFGPREVLHTEYVPGQQTLSNGKFDFGDIKVEPLVKIPKVQFDDRTYFGVVPVHQVDYSTSWWCIVDHYVLHTQELMLES